MISTLTLVFFSFLFTGDTASYEPFHVDLTKLFGVARLAVLDAPDRVETFRVKGVQAPSGTSRTLVGYPILKQGPDLNVNQVAAMHRLIFDPQNHPPIVSSCIFEPGIVLRYSKGKSTVLILLCFKCQDWLFVGQGEDIVQTFSHLAGDLGRIAKALFPKDPAIQALP